MEMEMIATTGNKGESTCGVGVGESGGRRICIVYSYIPSGIYMVLSASENITSDMFCREFFKKSN